MELVSRSLVRVATAGSVDDGKSTLIGRLLFDTQSIMSDQYEAIRATSEQSGEKEVNLALLTDGLRAEREQKITIDVAYRYFTSETRRFILADTPGHAQFTRNMVTGASLADVAIVLIDASRGITTQTRRHLFITRMLRIPHVLVAVNKMDLVAFSESTFKEYVSTVEGFSEPSQFQKTDFIPISAYLGDNVALGSENMPWYEGPHLLEYLNAVDLRSELASRPLRMPVQYVIRPGASFRGYAGQIASGSLSVGDDIVSLPSRTRAKVASIETPAGSQDRATSGASITITLDRDVELSRGDLIVGTPHQPKVSNRLTAQVCWMGDAESKIGQNYLLQWGSSTVQCQISKVESIVDIESGDLAGGDFLAMNTIGTVTLETALPVALDRFEDNPENGRFILINPHNNEVAAAAVVTEVHEPVMHSENAEGAVIWLTGLSGAGKTTLSDALAKELRKMGRPVLQLDGDVLRAGLNQDLGFSEADRDENVRRVASIAKVAKEQGLLTICSLISPLRSHRQMAREIVGEIIEVYVKCPLEVCAERDPKQLYAKAKQGAISQFTGISASYEEPIRPDLTLDTSVLAPEACLAQLLSLIHHLKK